MTEVFVRNPNKNAPEGAMLGMGPLLNAYRSPNDPAVTIANLDDQQIGTLRDRGLEVIRATQYQPLDMPAVRAFLTTHPRTMRDVMVHNRAEQAWHLSRGAGVHVAVVDTGVCGAMGEFSGAKQSPHSWAPGTDPWQDPAGHGSMTGGIAAGSSASGGRYDGVAPDATLISCRTDFYDTELYRIYEHLIRLVDQGHVGRLVVNNSYGHYQCTPPDINIDHPFANIVRTAIAKGIVVVFAAGNNHVVVCNNDPTACGPNSIWSVNSMDEVIAVGTVNENNRMDQPPMTPNDYSHRDSSRGPGQLASSSIKPDCVAPTYGETLWGCGYQAMEWWGTSGAAPQVAGLAALMLARNPALTPAEIQEVIRRTCVSLPMDSTCVGSGLIDCLAAVSVV